MIDPERIQRLAARMGNRKDALEMVHQMRCGGKKYGDGGDKRERRRMFDEVTSGILEQYRHNGRARGVNNVDYPLVDLHPELDLSLMLSQPGSMFTKLMAPSAYRGMVNGFANGEGAQALIYGLSPETGEWSEISKRAAEMQEGNFKKYSHYMAVGEKERLPKHIASTKKNLVERGITPDGEPYVVRKNVLVGNEDLPYKNPFFHSESYSGPDSWANSGSGSWKVHGYPDGGKFFRTNLQQESPLMYQPMMPINYPIETPLRFRPQPDLGDYRAPESTGMIVNYPITAPGAYPVTVAVDTPAPVAVKAPAENLFSDEMIARRALKQRYAESAFNDKAKSKAGAQGAWQIMPITYKDYLARGRGKEGDLDDPDYNRLVRDHTFRMIPRDLEEIWDENYSDRNKLALLYAGYNRGANGLKKYLRGLVKKGVDISKPENWVEGMNPETRNYVHFLAYGEDVPGTYLMNEKFENAARERGYMAEGGRLYGDGGPEDDGIHLGELQPAVKLAEEPLFVDTPYTADDFFKRWYPDRREQLVGNMSKILMDRSAWPFGTKRRARKSVDGYTQSMLRNMDENLKEYSLIASIWDRAYPHNSMYDPNRKWKFPDALKDDEAKKVLDEHIQAKNKVLKNYGIKTNDEIDDNARRGEAWDNYGFSYSNDPYHIFYSSAWPSNGTIVHERTHTLRPLPGEYEKYSTYYGLTPMEYATNKIKQWNDNLLTEAGKNKDDKSYYTSPKEIVARLNELRFNLGLNPKRIITLDDLNEIRKRASESERKDFLDLYTDETLLRFFNEVANAGEQESLYDNHLGNISANGGNLFRTGGPSGPINPNVLRQVVKQTLLRAIPRNILVGAADLADNVAGIPSLSRIKEIPEAGKFYTDALDNGESGYYEDGYIENPGLTFLLDRGRQSEMLQKMGYHPVNDGYYGSVTSATRKLNALKGDAIPIFQRGDDEVDFSEVEPVADKDGNYFFERTSYLGDIFGENELNHASYHPVSFYRHKGTGDIYVRGYDLNDYGKHDKNMWRNLPEAIGNSLFNQGYSYNKAGQTYGDEQYLAEIYDYIGNPFVQRTALVKAPEELVRKYFGEEYASGGKIRIKPENRGKFTALKKRTGHSASWFKAHGTPAQKKMAVFALNSRKWKHGDGGPIDRYSPEQIRAALAKLKETKK